MCLQVTGLQSSTKGSLAAFERMEQRVVAMEAEADAVGQVSPAHNMVTSAMPFISSMRAH